MARQIGFLGFLLGAAVGGCALLSACATAEDQIGNGAFGSGGAGTGGGDPVAGSPGVGGGGGALATGGLTGTGSVVGTGSVPSTGGLAGTGSVPSTGGLAGTGGAGTGGTPGTWSVGATCDNTQNPPCGSVTGGTMSAMWCEGGKCTCGAGQYCAQTNGCYWTGTTCP